MEKSVDDQNVTPTHQTWVKVLNLTCDIIKADSNYNTVYSSLWSGKKRGNKYRPPSHMCPE